MHDFACITGGKVADKPDACKGPQLWEGIEVDKAVVLNLTVEGGNQTKLGFRASISLFDNSDVIPIQRMPCLPGSCQRLPG